MQTEANDSKSAQHLWRLSLFLFLNASAAVRAVLSRTRATLTHLATPLLFMQTHWGQKRLFGVSLLVTDALEVRSSTCVCWNNNSLLAAPGIPAGLLAANLRCQTKQRGLGHPYSVTAALPQDTKRSEKQGLNDIQRIFYSKIHWGSTIWKPISDPCFLCWSFLGSRWLCASFKQSDLRL